MEPVGTSALSRSDSEKVPSAAEQLGELFGGYRAEWLREKLFDLFTEPSYFPEVKGIRPCILEGGRGTGKTTVLRCLSYEGQYALAGRRPEVITEWRYYGFYYRANTNRVTAFQGPELPERDWIRLFAHYVNLELVDLVLQFLLWFQVHVPNATELGRQACEAVATSLNLPPVRSPRELASELAKARRSFEAYINNVADRPRSPDLSMQGAPIDTLMTELSRVPEFAGKQFFFLIDEYENLIDYQQQVFNTLIKHSGELYTFKVGVKELGLRARSTLNPHEQLISPADYVRINITEKLGDRFSEFAAHVCDERLKKVQLPGQTIVRRVEELFGHLTEEQEAELLGVKEQVAAARASLEKDATRKELATFDRLSPLMAYLLQFWARSQNHTLKQALGDFLDDPISWERRFENYRYALLFTLKRGKRGIRKYYAGWDVLARLAAQNIRYLLELVDQSLVAHLNQGGGLGEQVSFKIQTEAAQAVGKKNLSELEGISVHGVRLTRLLLGLGRVFQVLAADPEGHTPEANQFALRDGGDGKRTPSPVGLSDRRAAEVEELLRFAVMHLALLRFPGNKLQDEADTKAYDYMVHPIFSAFFEFSYRRKRKITLSAADLLGLVEHPRLAIASILRNQNRATEEPLPDQLRLFEGFYAGGA